MLESIVYNYSWPLFPYVWNEIKFQIAYQSDLEFVTRTMERVVEEDLGEDMEDRVTVYRELLAKTPVNELEVRAHPRVFFRVENRVIDAMFLYESRARAGRSDAADPETSAALNAEPENGMFPAGANR